MPNQNGKSLKLCWTEAILQLEHGTSADRQLQVYEESGHDLKAVVDFLIKDTMENCR